jgi:HK97 family phage major capsid protein/HK97 family phage prohead protease
MSDLETRQASIGAVEGKTITGYAALYNSWSKPLMGAKGTFTERIAPGAFDASIAAGASLWFMHDSKQILANTKSGTLALESDAQGLKYTATLGDSQRDADVLDLVKRGVVSEMSFGFSVPPGGDSWAGEKRTLNAVNLREISLVEVGAYNATTSFVRSQETPVITKVIKPMNIRTMNAKLAELRAQNVEGTEVENRAEILAQIEEITEARNAAMAAADGIREAATPIQRTMDRRDASEEWRASPEYRDQWLSYLRGGRMPEQRAAMTTANPATNSVLIPKLYTDAMAHYASMATVARQLVDYKSGVQGYQTLRYNTLFSNDAITNAWTVSDVGTQASTEINPVFAEVPLAPAACLPFTTVSKQLLLQSNFDLEAEVVENLNRQFVRNAEWGLLSGGGSTGTNGSTLNQPTGLFTVQTGCTIATATSTGTSRALALTAACTVPNLTAMRYTSLPASYWGTASWLMGQDVYAKIAGLTINGVPVFVPSADAVGQAGAGFTLMGLPVFVSEFTGPTQATGAGAKNTIFSLGNHNEGYSAREWAGATIMRDDLSLAAAAQVKFQGTMFMNGNFTRAKAIVQMQVTNA